MNEKVEAKGIGKGAVVALLAVGAFMLLGQKRGEVKVTGKTAVPIPSDKQVDLSAGLSYVPYKEAVDAMHELSDEWIVCSAGGDDVALAVPEGLPVETE